MNTLCKTIGALAVVHVFAAPMSASATTVQITSGFMTVSEANFGSGSWMLAGNNLSAQGIFGGVGGGELPSNYFAPPNSPVPLGSSVVGSWVSDSIDGWGGQMVFNGVTYGLTSNNTESVMRVSANDILVGHAGSYMEPFTFTATFCGSLTVQATTCDATADLIGSGTLNLVVGADPNQPPGTLDIQSVSYRFAGVPEPTSIALLLTGIAGLGLTRRQTRQRVGRDS
jgi:hypothetical protein